jgi:hypothetical protein
MDDHPAHHIDFRPYAGQTVIIGCLPKDLSPVTQYYVLGPVTEKGLPASVLAIIADDQEEASEMLYGGWVSPEGTLTSWVPLVVKDEQGKVIFGWEALQAIVNVGKAQNVLVIEGVRLPT